MSNDELTLFPVEEPVRSTSPRGPDALVGKSLDRKRITVEEVRLAVAVLAIFNMVAETKFAGQVWLRKIIMRVREHPEIDVEQHASIISRNFVSPWWRNEPTPSVIYGNDGVFERAMLCKGERRPGNAAERQSDLIRKLTA